MYSLRMWLVLVSPFLTSNSWSDTHLSIRDGLASYFDPNIVEEMQIHSLTGSRGEPPNLHSFEFIDTKTVKVEGHISSLLQEVDYEIKHPGIGRSLCFIPRHALSFRADDYQFDILICYECRKIRVYRDSKVILEASIQNRSSGKINHLFAENDLELSELTFKRNPH